MNEKVIGIGFHKTGTSTLGTVLKKLGYKVTGSRPELAKYLINNDLESVFKKARKYDAFQDNPWPLLYKEFDKRYPNSKFILTIRDEEKWIKSAVNYFNTRDSEMRNWIYGAGHPKSNEKVYLERYRAHNKEVLEYFKDRKEDLLIVNWENGDDWESICDFLNKPIPEKPFPHTNKGNYKAPRKSSVFEITTFYKNILQRIS